MVLFLAVVVLGCASSGTTRAPRNPNLITLEELEELPAGTAYDAVQRLRPNWLRSRSATVGRSGRGEVNLPAVFADGVYFGPIDSLGRFGIEAIEVIEFLSARDATTQYGTGYPGGVIHLQLRKGFETRP
jgi:outer membrane receptor protein involved in Fe transport